MAESNSTTKRKRCCQHILSYFSPVITADIYWKLFVFSHYSHHTQICPTVSIKQAIEQEYIRILNLPEEDFFKPFKNITEVTLKTSMDKLLNDSNKIKRILDKKNCKDIIKLTGKGNFTTWIHELYPSPLIMGIPSEIWNKESKAVMYKFFFNSTDIKLRISPPPFDSFEFFFSNPNMNYLYIFNVVKRYPPPSDMTFQYKNHLYDCTLFSALFTDKASSLKNKCKSLAFEQEQKFNFSERYDSLINRGKSLFHNDDFYHTSTLALIHIPAYISANGRTENLENLFDYSNMVGCPIYIFHSYDELIKKLSTHTLSPKFIKKLKQLRKLYRQAQEPRYTMNSFQDLTTTLNAFRDLVFSSHHTQGENIIN